MQEFSVEQILILLLFFLFPLLQLAVERLRGRSAARSPDVESARQQTEEYEGGSWVVTPPDGPPASERPSATGGDRPELTTRRRDERENCRRGSRSDLRRAIVFSVILGPCRANDPPD